jgi:hypothetical protein
MNRKTYLSFFAVICVIGLTNCGSGNKITPPPVESISATGGATQSATVSTAFAAPLVATVTTNGTPTSGVTVTFTAPATGASGTFANGTATETDTTNASGAATSTLFTANGTVGSYTVTASVAVVSTTASFGLTNSAAAVPTIGVTSGSGQSTTVSTAFAAPLVATVTTNGAPTSGVVVTFTAPATGASCTFANGTATETDTTNASGVATSSTFTANATVGGPYTVAATVTGASTPASFSLTNSAVPVTIIAATGGTPQSATVSTAFTTPLTATVTTNGIPTSGVVVTFTAPATGASGTFAGGVNTATTDGSGVATSAVFTANGTAGAYLVAASVSGASSPASFSLTNIAGAAATITATSGTAQSAIVNTAFAAPLVATVIDSNSNPVSGAQVTFTAPATGASGTFANGTATETDTTNASGAATSSTFTANATAGGPYPVAASVSGVATAANFSLTNTARFYAFYLSGLEGSNGVPKFYSLAGSVKLDGAGNVLGGEEDYNDRNGFTSVQPAGDTITGGKLTVNATTGQGTLTLITGNTNLGVQFVNTNHALIVQFDGSATSSGSMDYQTLPSTLSGGYAFTLSGVDSGDNPVVYGGVFSVSGTTLANGVTDENDAGTISTATAFSGTLTAPDAFGRGTITGTNIAATLNYYIVGLEVIRIIDVDTTDSSVGSAFGQGSGTFSSTSLGNSVFAFEGNSWGTTTFSTLNATAGMFSTTPGSGTFTGVADNNEDGNVINSAAAISGTYSISATYAGYGSMTINPKLGDISALGIYLTDPKLNLNDPNNTTSGLGGALIADLDAIFGGAGVLIPQTDNVAADFAGNYAFGAQQYNGDGFYEMDFVGQGSVTSSALTGTGLVSDPGIFLNGGASTDTGVTISGTATPDPANLGRFTIPLTFTVSSTATTLNNVAIYQASGGQLFWIDEDPNSVFLGPIEQQGSLTALSAARRPTAKAKPNRR